MSTIGIFEGGPLDGSEDRALPLDRWGQPPNPYHVYTMDSKHRYRLAAFVGPLARYQYEGATFVAFDEEDDR